MDESQVYTKYANAFAMAKSGVAPADNSGITPAGYRPEVAVAVALGVSDAKSKAEPCSMKELIARVKEKMS